MGRVEVHRRAMACRWPGSAIDGTILAGRRSDSGLKSSLQTYLRGRDIQLNIPPLNYTSTNIVHPKM